MPIFSCYQRWRFGIVQGLIEFRERVLWALQQAEIMHQSSRCFLAGFVLHIELVVTMLWGVRVEINLHDDKLCLPLGVVVSVHCPCVHQTPPGDSAVQTGHFTCVTCLAQYPQSVGLWPHTYNQIRGFPHAFSPGGSTVWRAGTSYCTCVECLPYQPRALASGSPDLQHCIQSRERFGESFKTG